MMTTTTTTTTTNDEDEQEAGTSRHMKGKGRGIHGIGFGNPLSSSSDSEYGDSAQSTEGIDGQKERLMWNEGKAKGKGEDSKARRNALHDSDSEESSTGSYSQRVAAFAARVSAGKSTSIAEAKQQHQGYVWPSSIGSSRLQLYTLRNGEKRREAQGKF